MRKYTGSYTLNSTAALIAALCLSACANAPQHRSYPAQTPAAETPPPAPASERVAYDGSGGGAVAPKVQVREDAPLRYVVKKGDTLWGIASHFLSEPWQWPEIWYANEQVKNPHLIYPGDVLTLIWKDGRPSLVRSAGVSALDVEYISPQVRELPLDQAIPTIPLEAIRDFLRSPRLVMDEDMQRAPYILSFVDTHVIEGAGKQVYVRNVPEGAQFRYDVVRVGQKYVDPDTRELLGWEAVPVAEVEVHEFGDPATAVITRSAIEARAGDRLIEPLGDTYSANFYPHSPVNAVGGRIISLYGALSQTGQYQVVAINRGAVDGMEAGHVLSVMKSDREARDPYTKRMTALPDLYAGTLMLFKVDSRVSYGLIMSAKREIHEFDKVERPEPGQR